LDSRSATLTFSRWSGPAVTTSPLIMTGAGSVTEADVGALNSTANGFSTYLEP